MTDHSRILLVVLTSGLAIGALGAVAYAQMAMSMSTQGQCRSVMDGMGNMMGVMRDHCRGVTAQFTNSSATNTVVISNFSFNPETLKVQVGTSVTWINMDVVAHTVESGTPETPEALFRSDLLSRNESFSYTFNLPGTYSYYCGPHAYMTGTIVVN